jgi:hypothetical protein
MQQQTEMQHQFQLSWAGSTVAEPLNTGKWAHSVVSITSHVFTINLKYNLGRKTARCGCGCCTRQLRKPGLYQTRALAQRMHLAHGADFKIRLDLF